MPKTEIDWAAMGEWFETASEEDLAEFDHAAEHLLGQLQDLQGKFKDVAARIAVLENRIVAAEQKGGRKQ